MTIDCIADAPVARKAGRMNAGTASRRWAAVVLLALVGGSMSTSSLGGMGDFVKVMAEGALKPRHASWKEEVLLRDGSKIVVERSQTYGGYSEPASTERSLVKEEWAFRIPGSNREVIWKSDFRRPPEGDSLMLLQLNLQNGVPYIATSPAGCLSYNYWKRPNPPYVFFKYDGQAWRQIPLSEFPIAFTESNVAVGRPDPNHRTGLLSIETIKEENRLLEPYLRQIVREPLTKGDGAWNCPLMEYDGKGGWRSPGGAKAPHPIAPIDQKP